LVKHIFDIFAFFLLYAELNNQERSTFLKYTLDYIIKNEILKYLMDYVIH